MRRHPIRPFHSTPLKFLAWERWSFPLVRQEFVRRGIGRMTGWHIGWPLPEPPQITIRNTWKMSVVVLEVINILSHHQILFKIGQLYLLSTTGHMGRFWQRFDWCLVILSYGREHVSWVSSCHWKMSALGRKDHGLCLRFLWSLLYSRHSSRAAVVTD